MKFLELLEPKARSRLGGESIVFSPYTKVELEDILKERVKEAFDENGYFHTGDLGYIDKDGFLFITGRKKNIIVLDNGKNIYPEEVEYHLNNHPFVSECIVFGADCDEAEEGTQVVAKIFPDIQAITAKLKDKQAPSKEELQAIADKIKKIK